MTKNPESLDKALYRLESSLLNVSLLPQQCFRLNKVLTAVHDALSNPRSNLCVFQQRKQKFLNFSDLQNFKNVANLDKLGSFGNVGNGKKGEESKEMGRSVKVGRKFGTLLRWMGEDKGVKEEEKNENGKNQVEVDLGVTVSVEMMEMYQKHEDIVRNIYQKFTLLLRNHLIYEMQIPETFPLLVQLHSVLQIGNLSSEVNYYVENLKNIFEYHFKDVPGFFINNFVNEMNYEESLLADAQEMEDLCEKVLLKLIKLLPDNPSMHILLANNNLKRFIREKNKVELNNITRHVEELLLTQFCHLKFADVNFDETSAKKIDEVKDRAYITERISAQEISDLLFGKAKISLIQELKFLQNCKHENLVAVLGNCLYQGQLYVCKDIGSLSLSLDIILERASSLLSDEHVMAIFWSVAKGLQFLHDNDFVHNDVTPKNIYISRFHKAGNFSQGSVKLSSGRLGFFGKCQQLMFSDEWKRDDIIYRPPEFFRKSDLSFMRNPDAKTVDFDENADLDYEFTFNVKSDIYMFGISLWESLRLKEKPFYVDLLLFKMHTKQKELTEKDFNKKVIEYILEGKRPNFSVEAKTEEAVSESRTALYSIAEDCWKQDSYLRPPADEVVKSLTDLSVIIGNVKYGDVFSKLGLLIKTKEEDEREEMYNQFANQYKGVVNPDGLCFEEIYNEIKMFYEENDREKLQECAEIASSFMHKSLQELNEIFLSDYQTGLNRFKTHNLLLMHMYESSFRVSNGAEDDTYQRKVNAEERLKNPRMKKAGSFGAWGFMNIFSKPKRIIEEDESKYEERLLKEAIDRVDRKGNKPKTYELGDESFMNETPSV